MREFYRVHADVHLDRIYNNIKRTKEKIVPGTKIMAIIKADGYGHGAVPVAKILDPLVDAYGIAILEEGMELREAGIKKPILILGYTPQEQMDELIKYEIMPAVFSYETAKILSEKAVTLNKTIKVHIKIDTGMSRIGFPVTEESIQLVKSISCMDGIELEGCFTHFARADEKDKAFTFLQLERFHWFVERLKEEGVNIQIKHVSNSAGIMELPQANEDMVRSGISTYGLYPSEEVEKSQLKLEPAMEIKARVSFVKEVEAGIGVSYNSTYCTSKKTKIATIPVGYGDGYPRALSSKGRVLIRGMSAPILGRICMDQFMVDVTDIPNVQPNDVVTLVGCDGTEQITVEELGAMSHSFNYEIVCDIGKRVPRNYYFNGEKIGTLAWKNDLEFVTVQPCGNDCANARDCS